MIKIFYNGRIYDENFSLKKTLVVYDDKILYLGDEDNLNYPYKKEKIDLKGDFIFPTFFDSHLHLGLFSKSLYEINLSNIDNFDLVLKKLKESNKKEDIIFGFGWDDEKWKIKPHKKFLDEIFLDKFVILKRRDGHSVWVNSKVLNYLNIMSNTKFKGGKVEVDENGEPNGVLRDRAGEYVLEKFKDKIDYKNYIKKGIEKLYSYGIGSICNMDGDIIEFLIKRKYRLRIFNAVPVNKFEDFSKIGLKSFFGDEFLKIGGVKIFMDGSLGSKTSFMKDGFLDEPQNRGLSYYDYKELKELIKEINRKNFCVWVHAIGDLANELVLKSFLEVGSNKFNRIEHAQIVSKSFLEDLKKGTFFLSVQPSHIILDIDKIEKFLGDRGRFVYTFKTFLDLNQILCFGTDAPIEDIDPIRGIKISIKRVVNGKEFFREEEIDLISSFKAYTINPAKSVNEDKKIGSLKEGKYADFIVFEDDPMKLSAKIKKVYIGGEKVYERE
ncbi:MAG: amidohydrolase [Caldisericia bacterium]|jgi:predicted amidohydrolase YtcJ|nr:amidohydrolase [Caldisericia bacterium]